MNPKRDDISKRFRWLGGYAFVGVVLAGAVMWRPTYLAWVCVSLGFLIVWTIWMVERTIRGARGVPGDLVHGVLLAEAAILAVRLVVIILDPDRASGLGGLMDASLLLHVGLLNLGVLLAGNFLTGRNRYALLRISSLALILGAGGPLAFGAGGAAREALLLTCAGGVCLLAATLGRARQWETPVPAPLRVSWGGVAVLIVATAALTGVAALWWRAKGAWTFPTGAFGVGEWAFVDLSGCDSGSLVLGGVNGWAGWSLWTVGLFATAGWMVLRGLQQGSRRGFLCGLAACLSSLAMLAPGGYFLPITAVGFVVSWGALPRMTYHVRRVRSGLWLVGSALGILGLLGVAVKTGLVGSMAFSLGASDKVIHAVCAFLVATMFAWWFGARRAIWGLAALLVIAAAGGLLELAQWALTPTRKPELADWRAHCLGCAVALALYGLCWLARRGEAPDRTGRRFATRRERTVAQVVGWSVWTASLGLLAAWTVVVAWETVRHWRQGQGQIIVSDTLSVLSARLQIPAATSLDQPVGTYMLAATLPPNQMRQVWVRGKKAYPPPLRNGLGLHRQWLKGLPFGPFTLDRPEGSLHRVIPDDTTVFAVDANLMLAERRTGPHNMNDLLARLNAAGAVAFVSSDSGREYYAVRAVLRVLYPNAPCLAWLPWMPKRADVLAILAQLCRSSTNRPLVLITSDAQLAVEARQMLGSRIEAHWVQGDQEEKKLNPAIIRHQDVEQAERYFLRHDEKPAR